MLPIRKILHPTDYSDLSRPAFEFACSLARDFGAELVICHVSPPPIAAVDGGMVIEIPTGEAEGMFARLEEMKPADAQVRVTHRLLRGDPTDEILRLASASKADIIVMGTHGRGWLTHLLMGSVAEAVLRKAPCPVVTVKVPLAAENPKISTCRTAKVR